MNKDEEREMTNAVKSLPKIITAVVRVLESPAGKKAIRAYSKGIIKILEAIPEKDRKRLKELTS